MTQSVHSQIVYKDFLNAQIQPGVRWLDIGCGDSVLPEWVSDSIAFQKKLIKRSKLACGCDPVDCRPHRAGMEKYVGPCDVLPYPESHFDLVTANMVVEHVENPKAFAEEISRVLADNGRLLIHTPNLFYLPILFASMLPASLVRSVARLADGRYDEEIFPTHYRLNTRKAISDLPGFRVVELRCVETGPVLSRFPLANLAESLLIRAARMAPLEDLRADWIAVLEKSSRVPVAKPLQFPGYLHESRSSGTRSPGFRAAYR